nr:redoxin family protein [Halomonas elongata]
MPVARHHPGESRGESVELSSLSGEHVLINLWATWCPPCRRRCRCSMRSTTARTSPWWWSTRAKTCCRWCDISTNRARIQPCPARSSSS